MLIQNQQFLEVMCGLLLGDACLSKRNYPSGNAYYDDCTVNVEYANFKASLLGRFIPTKVTQKVSTKVIGSRVYNDHKIYRINTPVNPALTALYDIFYSDRKKRFIPRAFVAKHMSTLSLAIWYADDGTRSKTTRRINISMNRYPKEDCEWMSSFLKDKFGIRSVLQKNSQTKEQYRLSFDGDNGENFILLVKPFQPPGMEVKFSHREPMIHIGRRARELANQIMSLKMNGLRNIDIAKQLSIHPSRVTQILKGVG